MNQPPVTDHADSQAGFRKMEPACVCGCRSAPTPVLGHLLCHPQKVIALATQTQNVSANAIVQSVNLPKEPHQASL
jgi:hypothetical protein